MKTVKLFFLWLIITIVMVVSWAIGNLVGNAITGTVPPSSEDAARAGLMFLIVCAFNSALVTILLRATDGYTGVRRSIALVLYVFTIQSLLPQMETFFFASGIGISAGQAASILIAGVVVCFVTVMTGLFVYNKLRLADKADETLAISFNNTRQVIITLAILTIAVYPLLYLTFGYFIAWQNEALRIYYTSSPVIASFPEQLASAFGDGIYFFQVFRGLIWVIVTTPVVLMLSKNTPTQYLLVGFLSSLLPSSLLFIPNPYMPGNIAMTHFVETATSNFVWGLAMVWGVRRVQ